MTSPDSLVMKKFITESRGKSQQDILKLFLSLVILQKHLSENGSIVINDPEKGRLVLFDPNDFLEDEGYLKKGEPWQQGFNYGEGIAGKSYIKRESIFVEDVAKSDDFSTGAGEVPIASILCVPIIIKEESAPFGVLSFHVSKATPSFNKNVEDIAAVYVSLLGLVLANSNKKLPLFSSKRRIFIGCASEDLQAARKIQNQLTGYGLVRIWNQGVFKVGGYTLETLLKIVKDYDLALFLFSPSDTTVIREKRYLVARDNVIFEAGIFFSHLGRERTLLIIPKMKNLHLPTDLDGLNHMSYTPVDDPADLDSALGHVCNQVIEIISAPLPPIQ